MEWKNYQIHWINVQLHSYANKTTFGAPNFKPNELLIVNKIYACISNCILKKKEQTLTEVATKNKSREPSIQTNIKRRKKRPKKKKGKRHLALDFEMYICKAKESTSPQVCILKP